MAGKKTGYVYDDDMLRHENPWDSDHIECPDRLGVSHRRCQELGLLDRCERPRRTRQLMPHEAADAARGS